MECGTRTGPKGKETIPAVLTVKQEWRLGPSSWTGSPGKPIFGVEERPVPQSQGCRANKTSPTQALSGEAGGSFPQGHRCRANNLYKGEPETSGPYCEKAGGRQAYGCWARPICRRATNEITVCAAPGTQGRG